MKIDVRIELLGVSDFEAARRAVVGALRADAHPVDFERTDHFVHGDTLIARAQVQHISMQAALFANAAGELTERLGADGVDVLAMRLFIGQAATQ